MWQGWGWQDDDLGHACAGVRAARHAVTALDGDPNPNLATALGVPAELRAGLQRVPREEIVEERTDADGHTDLFLTRPFEDVLSEYGIIAPDGVGVLSMTGLLGAGRG